MYSVLTSAKSETSTNGPRRVTYTMSNDVRETAEERQYQRERRQIARKEAELELSCRKHYGQSFLLKEEHTLVPPADKTLTTVDNNSEDKND